MRLPGWHQIIGRFLRRAGRTSWADRRPRDFVRLSLRRLEDRRVLSGAPLSMGVTVSQAQGAVVVDATQAGSASQTFDVSLESKDGKVDLEITDNGTILFEEEIDKIASVTFRAGADNGALVVDFSNGDPIPSGGIAFIAVGNAQPGLPGDSLQLVNGSANNIAYTLSSLTDGQVSIAVGSQNSNIQFSGAAFTLTDELSAATRSFAIGSAIPQVLLSADAATAGLSQLQAAGGTTVDFQGPGSSLSVFTDPQAATSINLGGLDAGFSANLIISAGAAATIDVSVATSVGTGSLNFTAGDIEVDAALTTSGGTIELSASAQIVVAPAGALVTTRNLIDLAAPTINHQGIITSADGGTVRLDAGQSGTVVVTGIIDASSAESGHSGGSVDLLGKYVGLTGRAVVDVSGAAGGGSVRIGGDYQGSNASIESADRAFVGPDVVIN
ncbi:MAG TPA: hypothetical protein VKU82_06695, partial [Planctomycetaceae bacterium]|nr:hypothetical protein [Planctomycetaceae bacterium]